MLSKKMRVFCSAVAMILALIIIASFVSACSSEKSDPTEKSTEAKPTETVTATEAPTSAPTEAAKDDDKDDDDTDIEVPTLKKFTISDIDYKIPHIEIPTFRKLEYNIGNFKLEISNIDNVEVDDDGAVTLDASVLFATDSYKISKKGKETLKEFLDAYVDAIFSDDNQDEVKTIFVEGHTDTNGSHEYNQKLSLKRANAVKDYCLKLHPELKKYMVAKGYSYDYPVLKSDGSVDMAASRRVVFRVGT